MNVCVVGLGQVGFPVAQYVSAKGLSVWGYDINPITVNNANKTEVFKATTNWNDIPAADVFIICAPTGQKNSSPDLSVVFDTCNSIASKAKSNALVSIESTIVPGTSRRIYSEIFNGNINLVHVPHRYWADQPEKYGVNQIRVIGSIDAESLDLGLKFYQQMLGIPMHEVSSIETAEMSKISENSHRYLQIAYAEHLKMLCDKMGINFEELRAAMNTKWNVDLPEARDGIGRHCLPKDIKYVTSLAPDGSTLLEGAINCDKEYREWLTKQAVKNTATV